MAARLPLPEPPNLMISLPFRRASPNATIEGLYGMIVAQARSPAFYRGYGVSDTVNGRFEMIVLHLTLVLRRLREPRGNVSPIGQQIFDRFCQDMDDNFREMGVGDMGVPKAMRRVGEAFYGRAGAYDAALDADDPAMLAAAIARNVFGAAAPSVEAKRLAAYMRDAARRLEEQDPQALRFPEPEVGVAPDPRGGQ